MKRTVASLALWTALTVPAWSAPERFTLAEPQSRVSLEGHSPLHGFTGTTHAMTGSLSADWDAGALLEDAVVQIPVESIQTGIDARDHALQYTLRAAKHPRIVFRARSAAALETAPDARRYRVDGELEIGGVRRNASLDMRAVREAGSIRISGETVLKMSEFELKTPGLARFMGLEDRVRLTWETVWTPEARHA